MNDAIGAARVLVEDDNKDSADVTAELSSIQGFVARTAYDAAAAIDKAVRFALDIMFLDLGMLGADRFEIATMLRQSQKCRCAQGLAVLAAEFETV